MDVGNHEKCFLISFRLADLVQETYVLLILGRGVIKRYIGANIKQVRDQRLIKVDALLSDRGYKKADRFLAISTSYDVYKSRAKEFVAIVIAGIKWLRTVRTGELVPYRAVKVNRLTSCLD